MFKQVALSAILGITLTATVNGQINRSFTSEWIEGREATKAIARFGDLSPDVIRKCLIQMRQPAYLPGPMLEKKIIESQYLPIADGKRIDRLKAALQPVLDYHERSRMPVYVLRSEKPKAYLVETAVLICGVVKMSEALTLFIALLIMASILLPSPAVAASKALKLVKRPPSASSGYSAMNSSPMAAASSLLPRCNKAIARQYPTRGLPCLGMLCKAVKASSYFP